VAHGAGNSVFSQLTFFGPVFLLFLDTLGLPKTRIGLLLSFLPFCGLLAPFIAPAVARAGHKRVFLLFWFVRKMVTACFLMTPWVVSRFGVEGTFYFAAILIGAFALCRAIGETAYYPWFRDVVPARIRGQFNAIDSIAGTLSGGIALAFASTVIGRSHGLDGYMVLIGTGVVFGLLCVACAVKVPDPARERAVEAVDAAGMLAAARDRDFRVFLIVSALVALATMFISFVPLFMKERIGLPDEQVVRLQIASLMGGVTSSYLWGRLSDRKGSRLVMLSTMAIASLLPAAWVAMPRHSPWSFPVALTIALLGGAVAAGFFVAKFRMLYVGLVPTDRKTSYMAVYYAWVGLVGGFGPIVAGAVLDAFQGLSGRAWIFALDPYTPLFASAFGLLTASVMLTFLIGAERRIDTAQAG
jgi:Na+/melibiose symporter-like transporter